MNCQQGGSPKFLLHGISGLFNYGCEAIVKSTIAILREQWPACTIAYASRRPVEDGKVLGEYDIEILNNQIPGRLSPRRLLNSARIRLTNTSGWIAFDKKVLDGSYDCLISIGGDIFTIWKPPANKKAPIYSVDCGNHVLHQGKKYVLWGASIGPFDAWPECIPVLQSFLSRCDLITAREPETVRYLAKLGVSENVEAVADPAFMLPFEAREEDWPFEHGCTPVLGVNLSPISEKYERSGTEQFLQSQTNFLAQLIETQGVNVLLIPHVIAPHLPMDDDYRHLKHLQKRLPTKCADRVRILSPGLGAVRTKGVIQRCDALLAARMHCAIAGVSSGTPTLFLAYSRKAVGMAEYVYGNHRWVYQVDRLHDPEAVMVIRSLLDARTELRPLLLLNRDRFLADARKSGSLLRDRIHFENL